MRWEISAFFTLSPSQRCERVCSEGTGCPVCFGLEEMEGLGGLQEDVVQPHVSLILQARIRNGGHLHHCEYDNIFMEH